MSSSTVHVHNISAQTGEKEVKDFFSFCGKITSLEVTSSGDTKNATVTFEKETAAKTAMLLDNTQLGATQVKVTSASGSSDDDGSHYNAHDDESDELSQEMKPRSRIAAEYLAHGYSLSDNTIQRAIDLDSKHGVSTTFLQILAKIDQKIAATQTAKSVDKSLAITPKANSLLSGLTSYYEKAASTEAGKKVVAFYSNTSQQVADIHNEARRLADLKKQESTSPVVGSEKTTSSDASVSAHEAATAQTGIIESTKVDPLAPEKSG